MSSLYFCHQVACQDPDDTDVELEEQEAEFDSMLLEHAGDVGPLVAKLIGGAAFYPYFATIAPVLLKKLVIIFGCLMFNCLFLIPEILNSVTFRQ